MERNDTPADLHIKMSATLGNVDTYSYYPGYCGWYPYYYCYPSWSYEAATTSDHSSSRWVT